MTGLEIFLVIAGVILVIISFIVTEHMDKANNNNDDGQIDIAAVSEEVVKQQIDVAAQNAVDETVEKAEVMLDKISNEKIMAVNDYSDSVLKEINKNHDEAMFLYSMLNDKEKEIKNTVRDIENVKKTVNMIKEDTQIEEQNIENIEENIEKETTAEQEDNDKSNNNQNIIKLYNQGISNIEIAKTLGIGIGEVRLVIDLAKFRKDSSLNSNGGSNEQ